MTDCANLTIPRIYPSPANVSMISIMSLELHDGATARRGRAQPPLVDHAAEAVQTGVGVVAVACDARQFH